MPYDKLIQQGRIRPHTANPKEIRALLNLAKRDLSVAGSTLEVDPDWAYTIAYNAVLQASRALMFSQGFRPRGSEGHATVVRFVREALGREYVSKVNLFDQMRRKRHRMLYEMAGLVGRQEAKNSLAFAKEFIDLIRRLIKI